MKNPSFNLNENVLRNLRVEREMAIAHIANMEGKLIDAKERLAYVENDIVRIIKKIAIENANSSCVEANNLLE